MSSGLTGPFKLQIDEINNAIPKALPGTYLLGYADTDGYFRVNHVGRCDDDVAQSLRDRVGTAPLFKVLCYETADAAFLKECELFHAFRPPCTRVHPSRPKGSNATCPKCMMFAQVW